MQVGEALRRARTAGLDRLEAQQLLAHACGAPRAWLIAHGESLLDEQQAAAWQRLLERRSRGEPLGYLLGRVEFYGLELAVDPRVLIPRPDTETLVDWAVERVQASADRAAPLEAVDLGTGSGAIALALRSACPQARLTAVDASTAALALARQNADRLALPVEFLEGDWWQAVGERRFDLAVANPPYIAAGDPHLPALRHEPQAALVSGADGADDLRRIVARAPAHLRPGGWLLLEHGFDQAELVCALLVAGGFEAVQTRRDLAGRPRASGGRSPAADGRSPRVGQ